MSEREFSVIWNGSLQAYSVIELKNNKFGKVLRMGFATLEEAIAWGQAEGNE